MKRRPRHSRRIPRIQRTPANPGILGRPAEVEFLTENINLLAAFAYSEFLARGKGALLVDVNTVIDRGIPELSDTPVIYLADADQPGDWPSERESRWVEEYDPRSEFIIILHKGAKGISSYRLEPLPESPPVLYDLLKHQLDEFIVRAPAPPND